MKNALQQKHTVYAGENARNYGIDLLKILSMLLVALLHVLGQGGILASTGPGSIHHQAAWLLETIAFCSVNCFGLVSGYVGVTSRFRWSSILNLYLTVIFYTLGITAAFAVFMPGSVGLADLIKALFPFAFGYYWYFTAYFFIFFFFPAFNHVINTMGKEQAKMLTGAIVVLLSILPTVFMRDIFYAHSGYSALWLGAMYLIGAYIKKYDFGAKWSSLLWRAVFCGCIFLAWIGKPLLEWCADAIFSHSIDAAGWLSYCNPAILLASIALLILFSRLRFRPTFQKGIAFFAPLAFSVYLIHVQPQIWTYFIKDRFAAFADMPVLLMMLAAVGAAAGIWLVCSLIDAVRLRLFRLLKVRDHCGRLDGWLQSKL